MSAPDERTSNSGLLDFSDFNKETETIFSFTDAIARERPFRDLEETRAAAHYLNNVLAFVEYGAGNKASYPSEFGAIESVMEGLGEIMRCCRLVSLRVEQFIDMQEHKK